MFKTPALDTKSKLKKAYNPLELTFKLFKSTKNAQQFNALALAKVITSTYG